jgi:hypothetical protein
VSHAIYTAAHPAQTNKHSNHQTHLIAFDVPISNDIFSLSVSSNPANEPISEVVSLIPQIHRLDI